MVWPLYLAGIISLLAQVLPTSNEKQQTKRITSSNTGAFISGLSLGVGLGCWLIIESRRWRLGERVRRFLQDERDRTTSKTLENGIILETLVSPITSLTATLDIRKITLPAGTSLTKQRSRGVEHYLVLKGTCTITVPNDNSTEATNVQLSKGDGHTLDPSIERFVSNTGLVEATVVRTTDGGRPCSREGFDEGVVKPPTIAGVKEYVRSALKGWRVTKADRES